MPKRLQIVRAFAILAFLPLALSLVIFSLIENIKWSVQDVIMLGLIIIGFILASFLARSKSWTEWHWAASLLLLIFLLFIWAELGVGLIGSSIGGD